MAIGETIGWRLQDPSEDTITPVGVCAFLDEAMAATK